MKFLMI